MDDSSINNSLLSKPYKMSVPLIKRRISLSQEKNGDGTVNIQTLNETLQNKSYSRLYKKKKKKKRPRLIKNPDLKGHIPFKAIIKRLRLTLMSWSKIKTSYFWSYAAIFLSFVAFVFFILDCLALGHVIGAGFLGLSVVGLHGLLFACVIECIALGLAGFFSIGLPFDDFTDKKIILLLKSINRFGWFSGTLGSGFIIIGILFCIYGKGLSTPAILLPLVIFGGVFIVIAIVSESFKSTQEQEENNLEPIPYNGRRNSQNLEDIDDNAPISDNNYNSGVEVLESEHEVENKAEVIGANTGSDDETNSYYESNYNESDGVVLH